MKCEKCSDGIVIKEIINGQDSFRYFCSLLNIREMTETVVECSEFIEIPVIAQPEGIEEKIILTIELNTNGTKTFTIKNMVNGMTTEYPEYKNVVLRIDKNLISAMEPPFVEMF